MEKCAVQFYYDDNDGAVSDRYYRIHDRDEEFSSDRHALADDIDVDGKRIRSVLDHAVHTGCSARGNRGMLENRRVRRIEDIFPHCFPLHHTGTCNAGPAHLSLVLEQLPGAAGFCEQSKIVYDPGIHKEPWQCIQE